MGRATEERLYVTSPQKYAVKESAQYKSEMKQSVMGYIQVAPNPIPAHLIPESRTAGENSISEINITPR